jgi:hypothetical protein
MARKIHLDHLSKRQRQRAGRKKESARGRAAYRKSRLTSYAS